MREVLILRLDAPFMSFGGVRVDNRGPTRDFPALAMIAGLLGNALGYDRRDAALLEALQRRIRYAVRCDRPGVRLTDFQTVDITQPFMAEPGWTTHGAPEGRGGGTEARANLHIRYRDHWADAIYTVALALTPEEASPDLSTIERALKEPERPLFLGRKPCLPAAPIVVERRTASSLTDALVEAPRVAAARGSRGALRAWVPEGESVFGPSRAIAVTDERDWANQIVVGRRIVLETTVNPAEATDGG